MRNDDGFDLTPEEREVQREIDYTTIEALCDRRYADPYSANKALEACMEVYDDYSTDAEIAHYRASDFRTLLDDAVGSGDL